MESISDFLNTIDLQMSGLIHADEVFYPLLMQILYPEHAQYIQSYMALAYRVWCDPSPAQHVFLPDGMQAYLTLNSDINVDHEHFFLKFYPPDHPELIAFLAFKDQHTDRWKTQPLSMWISQFERVYINQQRQKLYEQGICVVGLNEGKDHPGPHMVVLSHIQTIPLYEGVTEQHIFERHMAPILSVAHSVKQNKIINLSAYDLPIQTQDVRLLFNDPELFYERHILKIQPPYHPNHYLSARVVRRYLLEGIEPKLNTIFDRHQLSAMKIGWDTFKHTLPKTVLWHVPVASFETTVKLSGTIDLIWDEGLYLVTKHTPPSRNAVLNGIEPELPLLAALYNKPVNCLGYIHVKGHGEDAIQITRYNNPQELVIANVDKLATYYDSGSQTKPA